MGLENSILSSADPGSERQIACILSSVSILASLTYAYPDGSGSQETKREVLREGGSEDNRTK